LLCVVSFHCFDPNLPFLRVVSPAPETFVAAPALPYLQPVEARVPLPGCGAAVFAADPETFAAALRVLDDGTVFSEEDVTAAFGAPATDPGIGETAWSCEVALPAFGEYEILLSVGNERGTGTALAKVSVMPPAAAFPGGWYLMSLSSMEQEPARCLAPQALLDLLHPVIKDLVFPVTLPSAGEILAAGNAFPLNIALPSPLPSIPVVLRVDEEAGGVRMDGPDDFRFNLSGLLPFPGLDCVLHASIEGGFHDLDPADPDGRLAMNLTVEPVPGGDCSLVPAGEDCVLVFGLDGDTE